MWYLLYKNVLHQLDLVYWYSKLQHVAEHWLRSSPTRPSLYMRKGNSFIVCVRTLTGEGLYDPQPFHISPISIWL
jgi:hypothetical protein